MFTFRATRLVYRNNASLCTINVINLTRTSLNGAFTPNSIVRASLCSAAKIPKNTLTGTISADKQQDNGLVYDKKPFKMLLEAGKKYSWCLCGKSKNQPICDGTHKMAQLRITQKPIRFAVEETKEYWLCNCKHTNNRPFCDGTHKLKAVQDQSSVIRQ